MAKTLTLKDEPVSIGSNVLAAKTDDGKLVLIIDPTKDLGPSKSSQKPGFVGIANHIIATTSGNVTVGKAKLGLNMYFTPEPQL